MNFRSRIQFALQAAWEVLYPRLCLHCLQETAVKDHLFCMHCLHDYVETDYHRIRENPVAMHFYGRVNIERATTLLDFKKGSLSQALLHELKYKNRKDIGLSLGERLGEILKNSSFLTDIEAIIPVPLHPKKLKKRGYNQSLLFARGIAQTAGLPVYEHLLFRVVNTKTQTRKSRMQRIENVAKAFELKDLASCNDKNILLVDDVITTGATIEACARKLIDEGKAKVSVAAIALG